jgi:hypothetical protein
MSFCGAKGGQGSCHRGAGSEVGRVCGSDPIGGREKGIVVILARGGDADAQTVSAFCLGQRAGAGIREGRLGNSFVREGTPGGDTAGPSGR